jgi:hypothetical protein
VVVVGPAAAHAAAIARRIVVFTTDETRIDVVVRGFEDLIERRGDGEPRNPRGAH